MKKKQVKQTETIDKITVVLNPWLVNDAMPKKKRIDPHNRLTLHRFGNIVALAIHWEWINTSLSVHQNIVLALHELIKKGYIVCPDNEFTLAFINMHLGLFVFYVQQIEFAFDFQKSDITIQEKAVENGKLMRYRDRKTGELTDNYYTPDYHEDRRKSLGIIYDKGEKDRHDNKRKDTYAQPI